MTSFADFAERIVALQVDHYEQAEGEYNQDPFSVRYKTRMSTERVFGLCEGEDQPETWKSLHASHRLRALAVQFEDSLASEEDRQRALFRKHCETLAQKEQELADIQYAEESGDPLSSILSSDPLIKNALLEYRRYGLGDLRYISNAHVLAVVCPVSRKWFFPQKLPTLAVRLQSSLFSSGDTMGSIEQDEGTVSRCHVPDALRIPKDRQPLWFSNLLAFHPEELLQSTPWTVPDQDDSTRSPFDPVQELIRAMVVTRQVSAFLGREDSFPTDSYAQVDRLHAAFYQLGTLEDNNAGGRWLHSGFHFAVILETARAVDDYLLSLPHRRFLGHLKSIAGFADAGRLFRSPITAKMPKTMILTASWWGLGQTV